MITKGFKRQEGKPTKEVYYPPYSIYKRSIQLFIKRLRKNIRIKHPKGDIYQRLKYFACGEYGSARTRPHYHIIIMGYDFLDKRMHGYTSSKQEIYRSKELEKLWPYGYSSIGEVTYQSAGYVARYSMKKTKEKQKYQFVDGYDEETGEIYIHDLNPEFLLMSKGIGKEWWLKYKTDTYKDYVMVDNKKLPIPRYYDKQLELTEPNRMEEIKQKREEKAKEVQKDDTAKRRYARNIVKQTQSKMLKRGYENEEESIRNVR